MEMGKRDTSPASMTWFDMGNYRSVAIRTAVTAAILLLLNDMTCITTCTDGAIAIDRLAPWLLKY